MKKTLQAYLTDQIKTLHLDSTARKRYLKRLESTKLTREENPLSHCCSMIIPFEAATKKLLVVQHKKANSWIFPGGHIDALELPPETAIREAEEEIGLLRKTITLLGPFGAQLLDITNPQQTCREHYDLFYAIPTNSTSIVVNMREFTEFAWLPVAKAKQIITLQYYKDALDKFVTFIEW